MLFRSSLLRYHELPGWNPYACGGYPAWGYIEGGTILVSPFLPAYLALPLALALRVEVLGSGLLGAAGLRLLRLDRAAEAVVREHARQVVDLARRHERQEHTGKAADEGRGHAAPHEQQVPAVRERRAQIGSESGAHAMPRPH